PATLKGQCRTLVGRHAQVHVLPIRVAILGREHAAQDARVDLHRLATAHLTHPEISTKGSGYCFSSGNNAAAKSGAASATLVTLDFTWRPLGVTSTLGEPPDAR